MKNILFGLIPALVWGIQPIVMTKIGGKSTEKVMGMGLGIFLSSFIVFLFKRPTNLSGRVLFFGFIDGLALSYGLINQIRGLALLGVAKGTPISTGTQLIGATLVGTLYFKEWSTREQYIIGIGAIAIIILGIAMTAYQENKEVTSQKAKERKGMITLVMSSIGFIIYTIVLRIAAVSIWDALLAQGFGMLVGAYLLSRREDKVSLFSKETKRHILTGLIFSVGNVVLMISNTLNGLAIGFTLTQMSVVISTICGLVILKEEKTNRELRSTMVGLAFVVVGGVLIGVTKG